MWAWKYFSVIHIIQIPEYMNVMEASLYITSATMYPNENYGYGPDYDYTDTVTWNVHCVEMTGTSIFLSFPLLFLFIS